MGFLVLQDGETFFVFLCYDTHKDVKVQLPLTILNENGDYCRKKSVLDYILLVNIKL